MDKIISDPLKKKKILNFISFCRFYMPHGLAIDQQNDYYTTDVGSHQVIKWSLSHGYVRSYFFESWQEGM